MNSFRLFGHRVYDTISDSSRTMSGTNNYLAPQSNADECESKTLRKRMCVSKLEMCRVRFYHMNTAHVERREG
jgi:hypothetical protein